MPPLVAGKMDHKVMKRNQLGMGAIRPQHSAACGWLLAGCACLLLIGCSLMPLSSLRPQGTRPKDVRVIDDGYEDYIGVMHIHTVYSDGAGTFEELARIANAQRLNFLIVTDHNTLKPLREGKQGWHGMTLILVGTELSTRNGHYLALNVTQEIDALAFTTQEVIDQVNLQGGLGFIAHPFGRRRWDDWSVRGFTGIEAYNTSHDTLDENRVRLVLWTLTVPTEPFYLSILDRPYEPLHQWDVLIPRHGKVVGIGSADAHEYRVFGLKFAPYEVMFRFVRTHLLIPSAALTESLIYDALRKGHAYCAFELAAEARGFTFAAHRDETLLGIMGDEVTFQPGLSLSVSLPAAAVMTLFKDGQSILTSIGMSWEIPLDSPGVYRLEVMRHNKPWIISNPIYVRPAQAADSNQQ